MILYFVKLKLLEVAVIGLTNCGKSTFINSIMKDNSVCTVSSKPHTTRDLRLGSFVYQDTHIILFDTPGLNNSKEKEIKEIDRIAKKSFQNKDLCIIMFDGSKRKIAPFLIDFGKEIKGQKIPVIALINKIDKFSNGKLLPIIEELKMSFDHIIPISALDNINIDTVLDVMCKYAKRENEQEPFFTNISDERRIIDRTSEVIFENFDEEIPYQCTIQVDRIFSKGKDIFIYESIFVKKSHYPILVGKVKIIGESSRIKVLDMLKNSNISEINRIKIPRPIGKVNLFIEIKTYKD